MKWTRTAALSALAASPVVAQQAMSLCDMYTTALLMNNTAANQYALISLVVNTALIGNYTKPNMNAVTGILVPGQYMGKNVTLLPYFNGGLISTNRGTSPSAVNFLDGGGAIPLAENKPANDTTSNQYKLVTHLYEFFGGLLQCSQYGMSMDFPSYQGNAAMYEVHKFMNLDPTEMGYFIQEVGLAAASFGVSAENVTYIGTALTNLFDMRCSPRVAVLPSAMPDLQAICINSACPVATSGAICTSYNKMSGSGVQPMTASMTIGPQLSDLAPQLSSIAAGEITPAAPGGGGMGGGLQSFSTTIITTSVNSTATTETSLIPIGGGITTSGSTIPNSVIASVTETMTTGSSTITTVVPTTEVNPALISSAPTVISSVITSGSSTYTTMISTTAAVSTATKGNNAPIQTAGLGLMAVAGAGALIGQMF